MSRQSLFLCPASPYTAEQQAATSQKSQLRNSYSEKKMRESMIEGAYATENQNWGKLRRISTVCIDPMTGVLVRFDEECLP